MSENDLSTRYELKMAFEPTLLQEVRSWVQIHPSAFVTTYPPRWVNSFYFDTLDMDSYNDHLADVPLRRKLRFRWYGESLRYARGQMEVKNKSEQAGWKIIQAVKKDFDFESMDWGQIMDKLRQNTIGIINELLCVARPVVLTVYFREYFVSADGVVRLTIDSDLQAYEQMFTAQPNLWFRQPMEQKLLIELKSEVGNASVLADVLAHFPKRSYRNSKYLDSLVLSLVK
jgi:hypothetical protein